MCSTSETADTFNTRDEIVLVFTKKRIFFLIFSVKREKLTCFSHLSLILPSSVRLVRIILGVNTVCIYEMVYNVILFEKAA